MATCGTQPNKFDLYDTHIRVAMLAYVSQDYKGALQSFQQAFKVIKDEDVSDYFYAAAAALHLKKSNLAKKLIETAIIETKASQDYFNRFKEFNSFRSDPLFNDINERYPDLIQKFFQNLPNPGIYKEVDSLVALDQQARSGGLPWGEIETVDSVNIYRLMEITKKYGWQDRAWLILWHQRGSYGESNVVWNHFKPLIDQGIEEEKIRKSFWAIFEDEKAISEHGYQIYGMYQNQFPIKDIESVDARRTEIGLLPLWYLNQVYGQALPDGYVTKDQDNR